MKKKKEEKKKEKIQTCKNVEDIVHKLLKAANGVRRVEPKEWLKFKRRKI